MLHLAMNVALANYTSIQSRAEVETKGVYKHSGMRVASKFTDPVSGQGKLLLRVLKKKKLLP
jgi:hypothetical protein